MFLNSFYKYTVFYSVKKNNDYTICLSVKVSCVIIPVFKCFFFFSFKIFNSDYSVYESSFTQTKQVFAIIDNLVREIHFCQ